MYSINFPKMLSTSTSTLLVENHAATAQNLILMLKSDRFSLFGDPYYGTLIKSMLFELGDTILQDLVIDEIYSCIQTFMPQIKVSRNDITLTAKKDGIYVTVKCVNLIDYLTDLYTIRLTDDNEI